MKGCPGMTSVLLDPPGSVPSAADRTPRPGPLGRLGRVAYRRRGRGSPLWVAALATAAWLSVAFAGDFQADYSAPGSDSRAALDLLEQRFPAQSGATIDVVVRADAGAT